MTDKIICHICKNPKRKPRFITQQIIICQWCITEVSNNKISPKAISEKQTAEYKLEPDELRIFSAFSLNLITDTLTIEERPNNSDYEELKKKVRKRDSYKCVRCFRGFEQGELHVHHIIPLSSHGRNSENNLVTLCHPCHNKQHPNYRVTRTYAIKRRPPIFYFVSVDIETTGLSNSDSIIEIAATKFANDSIIDTFSSLIRTRNVIPEHITKLTGITQAMVDAAPFPKIVMGDFVKFIEKHTLVFHNASFDTRFISKYLDYFDMKIENKILDTLSIARQKIPASPNHKLSTLIEYFNLPVSHSHRAKDDSLATGLLHLALKGIKHPTPRKKQPSKLNSTTNTKMKSSVADYLSTAQFNGEKGILSCLYCKSSLRVPKAKNIQIRCPICRNIFIAQT